MLLNKSAGCRQMPIALVDREKILTARIIPEMAPLYTISPLSLSSFADLDDVVLKLLRRGGEL
jgi:hypothetical protein